MPHGLSVRTGLFPVFLAEHRLFYFRREILKPDFPNGILEGRNIFLPAMIPFDKSILKT
jgi:hypothetical protein